MGCVVITLSFSSVTLMTVSSVRGKRAANGGKVTLTYALLNPNLPDQPNRAVRTRMLRGVGGPPCEGRSYPDMCNSSKKLYSDQHHRLAHLFWQYHLRL